MKFSFSKYVWFDGKFVLGTRANVPVTNAHVEIIEELKKENDVIVMPVRFLKEENEVNSRSFPFNFAIRKKNVGVYI